MTDGLLLGVDVGGTSTKWVVTRADGQPVRTGATETPSNGPESVLQMLNSIYHSQGAGISTVGVAVPGHVDRPTGRTGLIPNLAGNWEGVTLVDNIESLLGVRAAVINDARAFGLAELSVGSAQYIDRSIFCTIGTGIGGAVSLGGALLRNDRDSVGELGHAIVVRDGVLCGCGGFGCAEAYAGVRAITRRYRALTGNGLGIDEIRRAADSNEEDAQHIIRDAAWAVGCAISNLAVQLGIADVVLGGGLGTRWPEFSAEVGRQLQTRSAFLGPSRVSISKLGDVAGALGAAFAGALTSTQKEPQ